MTISITDKASDPATRRHRRFGRAPNPQTKRRIHPAISNVTANTRPREQHEIFAKCPAKCIVTTAFRLVALANMSSYYTNNATSDYPAQCSTKVIASPFFQ
ncbi:hypothetical protein [Nocardia lijiangensis]|uniref:hypothetical protein n=1 Tax=Nocardia lijiangensis TaxID=299618 RepID=UPI000A771CB5|nr:hypothetical protein [Nocardia lijiangensis]